MAFSINDTQDQVPLCWMSFCWVSRFIYCYVFMLSAVMLNVVVPNRQLYRWCFLIDFSYRRLDLGSDDVLQCFYSSNCNTEPEHWILFINIMKQNDNTTFSALYGLKIELCKASRSIFLTRAQWSESGRHEQSKNYHL
jgi:hypothetical protein